MSADLWFAAGIVVFLIIGVWTLNRHPYAHSDNTDDDFDQAEDDNTAEDAALADIAELRRQLEIAELEAAYKARSASQRHRPPEADNDQRSV